MTEGSDAASYFEFPRDPSLKFCTQRNNWHQNLLPKKYMGDIQNVNSSILIYLIIQTLRPKKIHGRSLDPKNTKGVNFQPKKICQTPLSCILRVTPPPPLGYRSCILYRQLSARSTCLAIIACKILSLPEQPMNVSYIRRQDYNVFLTEHWTSLDACAVYKDGD